MKYEEIMAAMQQKENRAACADHCKAKGYDTDFLDLLDTSDPEKFIALVDKLHETACPQWRPRHRKPLW